MNRGTPISGGSIKSVKVRIMNIVESDSIAYEYPRFIDWDIPNVPG